MRLPHLWIWPLFRWYDFYIGVYVDTANATVYIFPVPMVGIKVHWIMEDV